MKDCEGQGHLCNTFFQAFIIVYSVHAYFALQTDVTVCKLTDFRVLFDLDLEHSDIKMDFPAVAQTFPPSRIIVSDTWTPWIRVRIGLCVS